MANPETHCVPHTDNKQGSKDPGLACGCLLGVGEENTRQVNFWEWRGGWRRARGGTQIYFENMCSSGNTFVSYIFFFFSLVFSSPWLQFSNDHIPCGKLIHVPNTSRFFFFISFPSLVPPPFMVFFKTSMFVYFFIFISKRIKPRKINS